MARSGSSSRFVSVNLNKSYGQPPSPSTSHGGSSASASASPSPGLSRPRVPNSHVGMVLLSRSSGRSQPSVSSAASASSRASKLAVPRPVNLPSLRREHAGNDPTIALVGASGSSGWTKQQVSAFHGDSPVAQPGVPVDSASVRSASMTIESSWGSPVSQGRVTPSLADVASMEQRLPSHQASTGRPAVYTPPGSRNASAINPVPVQYPPSEKAVIVRGEDFPTLQAAARPTAVPAPHRQRDMQQKQRDRQHELKDQHMKLQQLSQQQNNTEDVLHLEHHSGPQLQPAQPVRPQVRSQQPSSVEGRSYETRGVTEKAGCHFFGPSPLIRLTHTSNWADDERETLQSVRPQRMAQSDRLDSGRPRNGYQFSDSWVLDHSGAADLGRPSSRNGSLSGFGRDPRDLRDYEKNGSLGFEGRVSKDGGFSNAIVKGFQGDQLEVGLRDDIGHWGRGVGRNDFPKRDWGSAAKESNHNRDARLGNSSRSFSNRNNGLERDMNASTFRDADPTLRGDSLGRDMSTREVHSRDGSFRKDTFFSKHGLDDWQGDRPRKSAVGHQFGRSDSTSTGRPHAGARNDLNGLEYGREKRANVYGPDPFLEDPVGSKASSFFAVEAFVGMSGLEAKIPRRKKDELQNYRDPARELFEAELERVQKMQEQERQRMVEERERAIELARKEEEEREMLAREEELLRLKIEEEAREAVAQAEREVEEAAKKAEELRRAREEEKRMVILEEERRKEAARRKLLELEERIAKRESTQQQRGYSVREVSMGSFETARTAEMDVEDEDRLLPSFGKAEQNDECASLRLALPLQSPARREPVEIPNSHPRLSGSALRWPPDTRGGEMASVERNRVVQMRRRETLDDGPGLSLVSTQSHPRDDLPQLEHELEYRGFPLRDSNLGPRRSSASGASRSSSLTYIQERVQAERSTRKEQQWVSGQNEGFSGRHFSSDINAGYMDNGNERDADGWWGRDNRRRSQEGQRLTSPPLPFYLNGGEGDYPSVGRLRQSLPKQPRVPPPILGRATLHRQTVHPEDTQPVPSTDRNDNSEGSHKDSPNSSSQGAAFEADIAEKVDIVDRPPSDAGRMLENLDSAASSEVSVLLNGKLQVFDDTVEDGSSNGSQTCHEQGSHLNEIDAVSELTECEERLEEDETHTAVDMQETRTEESIGDDEDWLVQAREARAEEMGEEVRVHDCLHLQNEVAIDELEDQEWESSNVHQDEGDGQEHVNTTEVEEANWESQQMEEVGDGVMDDPDMPADSQWESDVYTPECEQQAETEVKDPALQDAVEDHVVQPLIQQHSLPPANAFDSVQVGQSEGLSHGQSLLQQFQQPFSFMAVPLPQSTTSNSVLSSMHGFQTQQELPYHLQMGLLPGTPLMPNAIQIGSIQMPLHVHPQMPQLAHLHHQQPPVFQFGQICHSVPFSQPLPPMQPTVQIHHAIGQPLLPQHHQAESLIPVDGSHGLPKFDQVLKGVNEMAMQSFNGLSAGFNLSVDRAVEVDTILGSGLSSGEQNDHSSVVVSAAKSTDVQTPLPVVEIGSSLSGADVNIEANQGTSAGRISGGRRRNNGPWSYGILGRGRGRLRSGKNHGFKGPYSVAETWPETGTREISRNRMFRRNFRRAEYKVRKPLAAFDGDPGVGMSQGKHLSSYAVDLSVSSRLESTERKPNEGPQEESRNYLYSRSLGGANTQNVESVPGSHPMQAGSKSNQADGGQTDTVRNRLTSSSQTKGVLKKYKSDDAGDAPLQTGVVFVFEQPGIEIQNDKDDFIEVRSKRQIVREQRELRDKAKMKEFKVKEQVARKQQKLSVKAVQYEEAAVASSSKHGIERWSMSSAEMVNREGRRAKQSPSAAFGSALPQFSATSTSIGTSASESCDDSQKTSKVSKSGQGQSMSIATHIDSGKMLAYGHRYRSNAPDSTPSINAAWGVQRSSHEVVSLTQIQLEEAMKPFRFEGMPSQMASISERGSTVLESGISLASGLALEKAPAPVKAPVSVPGPISSLLAGEKIQFGAVTSPTVISSGSHPTSPSFIGAIGSPLGFGADMTNIPTHPLSHARNFLGPDSNGSFTSNKISTTGEDNVHGQLVDPEAEAEAAASAVAVAAISNDETVGNHSDASTAIGGGGPVGNFSSFANSSGVEVIRPVIIQAPSISLGIDDSMVVALPADLSVETPAPLLQATLPSVPATSGLMLQSLPSRASPFPCLEMGTILGGPIFAFSPCEDAPLAPLEPGLAALGAGSVAGWQHRHSSTSDSFYGAPPPFMGPAGLPSIQGHPHMLVYTNPFTPVGQFGQLGVSFMGTAYHPSGKQPDWTHTPFTSSSGALNQNGGDMNAGLPGMMDPQHSSGAPNSVQAISVAGCSMMPVATPISLFDPNLSAPFQAQWSRAPAPPFPNYPLSGPAPGLNLQPRNSSAVPGDLGLLSQPMHMSNGIHQLPETSSPFLSGDVGAARAVRFPDELGLGYSVISSNPLLNDVDGSSTRGHTSSSASAEVSGSKSHQGRRISQSSRGNSNLATSSSRSEPFLGTQDARGNRLEASHLQTRNPDHQQRASGHHPNSPPFMDKRASQQAPTRGSLGADWAGSNQRKGSSRTVTVDRVSVGERGSASSSKLKQIYVAKPAAPTRNLDAA